MTLLSKAKHISIGEYKRDDLNGRKEVQKNQSIEKRIFL